LVNIIAGQSIVPELIQADVTAERILIESRAVLQDPGLQKGIAEKLADVRRKLGAPGAAGRVAEIALSMMN